MNTYIRESVTIIARRPTLCERWRMFLEAFWRDSYKRALMPLILITILVNWIEGWSGFKRVEALFLDAVTRMHSQTVPKNIFIVEITEEDYEKYFSATSPLRPSVLATLIRTLEAAQPAVIGVDIDTRNPAWCVPPNSKSEGSSSKKKEQSPDPLPYPNLVWAQVPKESPAGASDMPLTLTAVLGGRMNKTNQMGITRFPLDEDGVVRRERSQYRVSGDIPSCDKSGAMRFAGNMDSFFRIIRRQCEASSQPELCDDSNRGLLHKLRQHLETLVPPPDEEYLNFSGDRYSFQTVGAGEFLEQPNPQNPISQQQKELLQGRIVLIGGSFQAARDEYMTPYGEMQGVELIANAIESDAKDPILPSEWLPLQVGGIILDIAMGTLIVLSYFRYRNRPGLALLLSLASIVLLWFLAVSAFYAFAIWLNFVPVVFGMIIHQMYEGTALSRELREELEIRQREIRRLEEELSKSQTGAKELELQLAQVQMEIEELRARMRAVEGRRGA